MKKVLTLCVVHDDTHVLLGYKKRGFGVGRWNGFGGKVEHGETVEGAAVRELKDGAGIDADNLRKRGVLTFEFAGDPVQLEVHVFSSCEWRGEPIESDEMRPEWFRHTDIPFDKMWLDDKYWLPALLSGRDFNGNFYFLDQDNLLHHQMQEYEIAR